MEKAEGVGAPVWEMPTVDPEHLADLLWTMNRTKDIPGADMSSRSLDSLAGDLRPGGGLVIEGAGFQAAVQDADEPVGQVAERGAVAGADGPVGVIAGTGAPGAVQRG